MQMCEVGYKSFHRIYPPSFISLITIYNAQRCSRNSSEIVVIYKVITWSLTENKTKKTPVNNYPVIKSVISKKKQWLELIVEPVTRYKNVNTE